MKKIARMFGEEILRAAPPKRESLIFALKGELGSGKTTFVQGVLKGLGVKRGTTSPTFVFVKRFKLGRGKIKSVYHIDMYRIRRAGEIAHLGLKEIFKDNKSVVFIEWADKIRRIIPAHARWISFAHGKPGERIIFF